MAPTEAGIISTGFRMHDICKEFLNRRAGILKALTTDVDEFFKQCNPENDDELCLYGLPDRTWQLCPPPTEVPTDLPEPTIGINATRDRMDKQKWLIMVAVHSDSWLLRVAFYQASFSGFNKESRNRLFDTINGRPTLYEVVTGKEEEKEEEEEVGEARCASCGSGADGDWIVCSACQHGFHSRCVQQGICPACST